MPNIAIRGIRIKVLTITPSPDSDGEKLTCQYQLMSTADKVLAEQSVGCYGGMKVNPSPQTQKCLDEFLRLFRNDINVLLGLDTE